MGLALAIALPLIAAAAWLAWQEYENRREALGRLLLDNAHAVSAAVDRELSGGLVLAQALSHSPLLEEGKFAAFHAYATRAAQARPGSWLVLFEPSGQAVVNTLVPYGAPLLNLLESARPGADETQLPESTPEPFLRTLAERKPAYSDLFLGSMAKRPVTSIDVPVLRGGEARYVLRLVVPLDSYQALIRAQAERTPGSRVALVDGNGFVIARAANPPRASDHGIGMRASASFRSQVAAGDQGFSEGTTLEDEAVFRAYARVAGSGWIAVVASSEGAAFGPIRRVIWTWAAAAALLFAAGLVLAIAIARRIAEPMQRLAAMTDNLHAGEAPALPRIHTRELGQLAETIVRFARHSDERLRAATDAVPALISYIDRDLRYQLNNKAYEDWFGHRREEIRGRHVREVLGDASYEVLRPHFESALAGVPAVFETRVPYKDGGHRDIHASYVPDAGPDGKIRGFFVLVLDITQVKQAEEALRVANRRKDEFLAMLGHELRNPLAPVLTSAQFIAEVAAEDARVRSAAAVIERQAKQLARLVDDVHDVARIDRGMLALAKAPVDFADCVSQALDSHRAQIAARGQQIRVDLSAAPVWVLGDEVRLSQIVSNLAGNAVKFTPRGGEISFALTVEGDEAVFAVRDTGAGIEPEMLETIFEPFVQAGQSIDRSRGGLGLGLALVRRLAGLHGGSVVARSAGPGKGAEFIVRLPLSAARQATAEAARVVAATSGLRVLVVDDNHDAATSMALLLRTAGHDVEMAHEGLEALAKSRSFRPQAVLLDIGLPGMDGYAVALALRRAPETADTTLVALTGYGRDEDRAAALAAGFDLHLTKPVAFDDLKAALAVRKETAPAAG